MKLRTAKLTKRGDYYRIGWSDGIAYRRVSAGPDEQQAQYMLRRFNEWLFEGKDPRQEWIKLQDDNTRNRVTLKEFWGVYSERHLPTVSAKMQETWRGYFKNIQRARKLLDSPLSMISRNLVSAYMHKRMQQDGVAAATVNREAALIRNMLNRAVEWDYLIHNPLQGMRLLKEAPKRNVQTTREEILTLLQYMSPALANITEFAVYSGFRKENILSMKIEQVRYYDIGGGGEVDLLTKGNLYRTFALNKPAVDLLREVISDRREGYVFINPRTKTRYRSITRSFGRAVDRAGLKVNDTRFRFHDLRHLFATWLHKEGVGLDSLRFLLGHNERNTTDRYTTPTSAKLREDLDLMPVIRKRNQA